MLINFKANARSVVYIASKSKIVFSSMRKILSITLGSIALADAISAILEIVNWQERSITFVVEIFLLHRRKVQSSLCSERDLLTPLQCCDIIDSFLFLEDHRATESYREDYFALYLDHSA